jgi:hypothetical protein
MNINARFPRPSGGRVPASRLPVPETYLEAFTRLYDLRKRIEETLHAMVDILDVIDAPDEDREPWLAGHPSEGYPLDGESDHGGGLDGLADSEPSLAAPELVTCDDTPATPARKRRSRKERQVPVMKVDASCSQEDWAKGDRSGDDNEHDKSDDEPSLGALGVQGAENQTAWGQSATCDCEPDLEGSRTDREHDDCDEGEPTLGATVAFNQECAWPGLPGINPSDEDEPLLGWTGIGRGHPEPVFHHAGTDEREVGPACKVVDKPKAPRRKHGARSTGKPEKPLVVGRLIEDGGIAVLGTVEVARG